MSSVCACVREGTLDLYLSARRVGGAKRGGEEKEEEGEREEVVVRV